MLGIFVTFVTTLFFKMPSFIAHREKFGLVGSFSFENLPREIQEKLSFGLTGVKENGDVYPLAAKSWQLNNDRVYIIKIKNNLTWHDGTQFKADDINLNIKDVQSEVVDNETIKFTLPEPFAPFLTVISQPLFKKGLIGFGSHRLIDFKTSGRFLSSLTIKNIETGEDSYYKFYPNQEVAETAFKLGEVNKLIALDSATTFEKEQGVKITKHLDTQSYIALFLNTEDGLLSDKSVRLALAYAIKDKPEGKTRAISPLSPNSIYFNSQVKSYSYNLQTAEDNLAKSEIATSSAEKKLKIETSEPLLKIADKFGFDWQKLGFETEVGLVGFPLSDYQAILIGMKIPQDPDQYALWHSLTENNISKLDSPKIDKLLEDGRKTLDQEQRKEIYKEFQKTLLEECPAVFLFHPVRFEVERE